MNGEEEHGEREKVKINGLIEKMRNEYVSVTELLFAFMIFHCHFISIDIR